jgi:hypothetical protein
MPICTRPDAYGGRLDKKDTLGTAISNYMRKFSFYDI